MSTFSTQRNWNEASHALLDPFTAAEPYQDDGFRFRTANLPPPPKPINTTSSLPHRSQSLRHRQTKPHRPARPEIGRSFSSDSSPLAQIKKDHRSARRAPHVRRGGMPTDLIDTLDGTSLYGGAYHHEGPYDATLAARQVPGRAPVEAVKYSNAQALAATPRANIVDSLERKVPLQGIGSVPSGMMGPGGQKFDYEEYDVQVLDGKLGRWDDVKYLDADRKGKGEPCYTVEEREKAEKRQRKQDMTHAATYDDVTMGGMEMSGRKRAASEAVPVYPYGMDEKEEGSSSSGVLSGLKKKLSVRRRK